ncbi:MAG: DUF4832 domain-containing protein, partial [Mobilitalea sp.]
SRFIKACAEYFDGNPLINSIDLAIIGAWGEGGGTEFLSTEQIAEITDAYLDNFKITPLEALLHDPKSIGRISSRKETVGFRVDCLGDMGGFHGKEWSHMLDFYPENIQNFHMGEAWKKAPIVFEACWHMQDWYQQGWDIDYIINESLKWHISSYNNKGAVVPEDWKDSIIRWVNRMGYRFELRKFTYDAQIICGQRLKISALLANVGVAPIYHNYPLILRLRNNNNTYPLKSREDIRTWLPDIDILWEESFLISEDLKSGKYILEIGIETGITTIGNIAFANDDEINGYYPMGTISLKG